MPNPSNQAAITPDTRSDMDTRIGVHTFLVNAHTRQEALHLAVMCSGNTEFETKPVTPTKLAQLMNEAPRNTDGSDQENSSGAWNVDIIRIAYFERSRCIDYDRQPLTSFFVGERPHKVPHAQADPEQWSQIAQAIDDREALFALLAPVPAKTRTPPSRI